MDSRSECCNRGSAGVRKEASSERVCLGAWFMARWSYSSMRRHEDRAPSVVQPRACRWDLLAVGPTACSAHREQELAKSTGDGAAAHRIGGVGIEALTNDFGLRVVDSQ